MRLAVIAIAGAFVAVPAAADPGDHARKVWEKRAQCDKKHYEAKSSRDLYKMAEECNRELTKLDREGRKEAAKRWREAEKKWRERNDHEGRYYPWDDD